MPCPYTQLIFDDTKHVKDNDGSDTNIVDELPITTTVNGVVNHHQIIKEPLN